MRVLNTIAIDFFFLSVHNVALIKTFFSCTKQEPELHKQELDKQELDKQDFSLT